MGDLRMAALVTVVVADGVHVAPGNVFDVGTEEEAARLVEIGAATRLDPVEEEAAVATAAIGLVLLTGERGASLPAGTVLLSDDGPSYRTTDAVTIGDAGLASVPVLAEQAGAAGNLPAATELLIDGSSTGVDGVAKVGPEGLTGGADAAPDAEDGAG